MHSGGEGVADDEQRQHTDVVSTRSPEIFDVVEDTLLDLWKAVDDLARIHAPRLPYYRVTIFGSSRMQEGDPTYGKVRTLARELSSMGCDIVTGGGPGLMEAANQGAEEGDPDGKTRSFGLNIEVPHEQ
ncbi:MAG TPA: LOG family protein, partial [Gemmatimonadota bacterium]|nr:LOG family protein [Gemmatimonadota bacterium]